jgi:class 3 adenylate cyclase
MEFRLLGPLEVFGEHRRLKLGGLRPRALLAMLLLHANEPVAVDRLLEELWADPGAKNALEATVSRLRRGPLRPRLETRAGGYAIRVQPDELDLERFEGLLAQGREALADDPADAAETLREALTLFRGEPLADFRYEPFAQGEIARLGELRLQALEERIEADLALSRSEELVPELERLIEANPLRERLTAQLMLALYRSGRQAAALDTYRRARERLVEELALEPGSELRALEAAILRQETSLAAPQRSRPAAALREVRKTVTVLLADVAEPDALVERLDPEALRKIIARLFEVTSAAIGRHGGTVEKHIGYAIMAVFGVPELHEDDALRALRAAIDVRESIGALNEELGRDLALRLALRIGINTGEVVTGDPATRQPFVTGEPVVTAAQVEESAGPGEIVIGEATRRLVANAVRVEPAAPMRKDDPVACWRLVELIPGARPFARRIDAPLIGRDADLARLENMFGHAVRACSPCLLTVIGAAGIGKSRLAEEFVARADANVRVMEGRCLPYGEGITFWALRELVLALTGPAEPRRGLMKILAGAEGADWIADRVLGAIGLETIAPLEEVFAAARKLLESVAHRQPVLLVFEDIHWAEPSFLDLVAHVVEFAQDVPLLVVCLARPDLLEERPEWGTQTPHASMMEIGPLADAEAERFLDSLGAVEYRSTIKQAAEGNPLFLEQIVAWLAESRLIEGELPVPPTTLAILASRLERLGPGERSVLDCAAVIGRDLWEDAVLELVPHEARPSVPRHLETLISKQFLRPAEIPARGQRAFRFRHVLIQDAAYRAVPKETRARLHERFADWLEQRHRQQISEVEEIVGYHLEQAFTHRRSLGVVDSTTSMLGERAGRRLAAAGFRAWGRADIAASINLLGRAASLLPSASAERSDVLCDQAVALAHSGAFDRAKSTLADALATAYAAGDRRTELYAGLAGAELRIATDPDFTT